MIDPYQERHILISPTLDLMARRFNLDLDSIADKAITDHVVQRLTETFTPRMRSTVFAARELAEQYGHSGIGCEHVFLAMLLEKESVPSQVAGQLKIGDELINRLRLVLASDDYNRGSRT